MISCLVSVRRAPRCRKLYKYYHSSASFAWCRTYIGMIYLVVLYRGMGGLSRIFCGPM